MLIDKKELQKRIAAFEAREKQRKKNHVKMFGKPMLSARQLANNDVDVTLLHEFFVYIAGVVDNHKRLPREHYENFLKFWRKLPQ